MGRGCSHEHLAARGRTTSRIGQFDVGPRPAADKNGSGGSRAWETSCTATVVPAQESEDGVSVRASGSDGSCRWRRECLAAKSSAGVALSPESGRVSRWALPSPRGVRCRQVEWSRSPTGDGNDPVLCHCSTQLGRIGEIGSTEPWLHHGTGRLGRSREHRRARVHRVRRGRPSRTPDRARGRPDSKAPPLRGEAAMASLFSFWPHVLRHHGHVVAGTGNDTRTAVPLTRS